MARPKYRPPSGHELHRLLERWRLTQADVADVLCVDPRTVGRWCQRDRDSGSARSMPYASLAWLAYRRAGVTITPTAWRKEIRDAPPPVH